jgi:4,5-DOPA dioxygenase extradiol
VRFEKRARELLLKGDNTLLIAYDRLGCDAMLSLPMPQHYLPLFYVPGLLKMNRLVSRYKELMEAQSPCVQYKLAESATH